MIDIKDFILSKIPVGVIVLDRTLNILYSNKQAELFLKRYKLPDEIVTTARRIFDAINRSKVRELFPGEIHLRKKLENSQSDWIFGMHIYETPEPLVAVCITEESLSKRIDLNKIRIQFRLTRRETDVLTRVLDGLKNAEIAYDLEISEQTVKDHLSNIYKKTGAENKFTLVNLLSNLAASRIGY